MFWGVDSWHPVDPKTGKALSKWIHNPFAGSLSASGDRGILATTGVQFSFRLVGPDEMELEMASFKKLGGLPPTAFHAALKRGAVGTVSRREWPDLSGSWRGKCLLAQPGGLKPSSVRLDLVRQDGELLWMDDVWSPTGPLTESTDPKALLRERMMGSLNPSGTGGVMTKAGVRVGFRMLSSDRMEVEFIRMAGEVEKPTAFYAVVRKGSEEPLAPVAKRMDLVGTWVGSYRYGLSDRPVDATSTLVITRQEGNILWADDVWIQPREKGDPVQHRDPMCGSLSPDQTHGALAKKGACFMFRVLDADHLELAFTGIDTNPGAFFGLFNRKR
ncbi:MAG: hypothetical protein C4576_30390 [Desulfobacteraceae bacterium]|nr:MAG: hypothetical protein C4576_30390 [Desulfobacteraceae bacterium]